MEELLNCIKRKDYQKALQILSRSFDAVKEEFELYTIENPNENLFKFILYAGEYSFNSDIVSFNSMILATALNYFKNAYDHAYNFAVKLIKLQPENIENWEWLLFFANVPDIDMPKIDLEKAIIHILKLDDINQNALDLLNRKFTSEEKRDILAFVN